MNPSQIKLLNIASKWNNFLTIFGLNCLKEVGRNVNNVRYVVSPFRITYCIFLTFSYLITFVYQLKYVDHVVQGTFAWKVLTFYLAYSGSCEAILLLITSILQSKNYANLLSNVLQCEFKFSDPKAGEITKKSTVLLVSVSFTLICSFTNDVISRRNEGISIEMVLNIFIGYTFLSYNIITVSHFGMAQFWLRTSFYRINEDLAKIKPKTFLESSIFTTKDFKNDHKKVPKQTFGNLHDFKNFNNYRTARALKKFRIFGYCTTMFSI